MLLIKDPGARIDYAFDWGDAYLDGQTIEEASWAVEPDVDGGVAVAGESHDLLRCEVYLHLSAQARIGDGQGLCFTCPVGERQP